MRSTILLINLVYSWLHTEIFIFILAIFNIYIFHFWLLCSTSNNNNSGVLLGAQDSRVLVGTYFATGCVCFSTLQERTFLTYLLVCTARACCPACASARSLIHRRTPIARGRTFHKPCLWPL